MANPAGQIEHVVIFVQENHTTDNYFRSMAAYGANVATDWPTSPNPPTADHPHDRHAYAKWLTNPGSSVHAQFEGSPNIGKSAQFDTDAAAGKLPTLSMIWHDSPNDEHPVADVSLGMHAVWHAVDAAVQAGLWDKTVFMLTWDDWGGYDDHV